MDQDKLHQWIGSIVTGQSGWFHMYPYSKLDDSNCLDSCSPNIFALSWLSSAEALRMKTPSGFHKALESLEAWAKEIELGHKKAPDVLSNSLNHSIENPVGQSYSNADTQGMDMHAKTGSGQSSISARATYSIEDDDEEESGSGAETVTSQSSSESAVTAEEVPIESTRNSTLRDTSINDISSSLLPSEGIPQSSSNLVQESKRRLSQWGLSLLGNNNSTSSTSSTNSHPSAQSNSTGTSFELLRSWSSSIANRTGASTNNPPSSNPNQPSVPLSTSNNGNNSSHSLVKCEERWGFRSKYVQDSEREGISNCLFALSTEAVPCWLSSRKSSSPSSIIGTTRMLGSAEILDAFYSTGNRGVSFEKEDESSLDISLFPGLPSKLEHFQSHSSSSTTSVSSLISSVSSSSHRDSEGPFYFGLDCRSPSDRCLGIFPKAFGLEGPDFSNTSDTDLNSQSWDAMSPPTQWKTIFDSLYPMAHSIHLCIFGAGAEYWHWKLREKLIQQQTSSSSSFSFSRNISIPVDILDEMLNKVLEAERSYINSVASFFIQKGFPHVSILHGGFYEAVKYLHDSQDISGKPLTSFLVDADLTSLHSMLGVLQERTSTIQTSIMTSTSSLLANASSLWTSAASKIHTSSNSTPNSTSSTFVTSGHSSVAPSSTLSMTSNNSLNSSTTASSMSHSSSQSSLTPSSASKNDVWQAMPEEVKLITGTISKTWTSFMSQMNTSNNPSQSNMNGNMSSGGTAAPKGGMHGMSNGSGSSQNGNAFVIDGGEEEEGEGEGEENDSCEKCQPSSSQLSSTDSSSSLEEKSRLALVRTEAQKQQALNLHKLAGLQKGDNIVINKDYLPGAVLFPCMKVKIVKIAVDSHDELTQPESSTVSSSTNDEQNSSNSVLVHRYLVVTKERFMVLDAQGGAVGSSAIVKSNHHLTELIKMTFKKKDPELITLFFLYGGANKTHQYRVPKKQQFVEVVQANLKKFK